jgi:hypothetical protein
MNGEMKGLARTADHEPQASTFDRIVSVLADRNWHTRGELARVTPYPDWWLEELRHERLELAEDGERVRLLTPTG